MCFCGFEICGCGDEIAVELGEEGLGIAQNVICGIGGFEFGSCDGEAVSQLARFEGV